MTKCGMLHFQSSVLKCVSEAEAVKSVYHAEQSPHRSVCIPPHSGSYPYSCWGGKRKLNHSAIVAVNGALFPAPRNKSASVLSRAAVSLLDHWRSSLGLLSGQFGVLVGCAGAGIPTTTTRGRRHIS